MPDDDKKMSQAMADALGVKLVSDDADNTNQDQNADTDKQNQQQDKTDQTQDQTADQDKSADKGDVTGNDQDANKDGKDSGGDQDGQVKSSDQANDTKTIPDASKSADGTDQQVDFDKLLAERSGGKWKSITDIEKALEEAPTNAFANEQIAKLNDYVKSGGRLEDFVRTQTVDYSKMTPEQLVAERMMLDDPELTAQEVQLLMEEDFGVADDASERAKQVATAKLKKAAREAKDALEANKQKWATPLPDQTAQRAEAQQRWEAQLSGTVDKVSNIDIALNQTDNFSFKIEDAAKAKIKENYRDLSTFFKRYIKPDGSEDTERFVKDMIKLENFDLIVRSAASASKNQGKKDVVDDIKNTDFSGKNKGGQDDTKPGIEAQAAAEFFKNNPMR